MLPNRPLQILIVDDDPIVLTIAEGGAAGINTFVNAHKRGEPFEAVITDLGMPHTTTPVILMTGWGQRMNDDNEVLCALQSRAISAESTLLFYCDALGRFSIVSFVWGTGQKTAIHDHIVWGLVGVLRGEETSERFVLRRSGQPPVAVEKTILRPGDVELLLPSSGDIHQVTNSGARGPAVSIHVYDGNIGAIERHEFDSETGERRRFVSGYSNTTLPNIWS